MVITTNNPNHRLVCNIIAKEVLSNTATVYGVCNNDVSHMSALNTYPNTNPIADPNSNHNSQKINKLKQ